MSGTPVAMFTPAPSRWKLSFEALSFTWMPYVPAATWLTTAPSAVLSWISKPGPTLALRLPMKSACEFVVVKRETTLAARIANVDEHDEAGRLRQGRGLLGGRGG